MFYIKDKIRAILNKGARFFISLVKPKSKNEDLRRREFILNIILIASIIFITVIIISTLIVIIAKDSLYKGDSIFFLLTILLIFISLYKLSRKGLFSFASYLLIIIYFLPTTYSFYKWGIVLPQCLLTYLLIIVISGILLGTKIAFINTFILSFTLILIGYLQVNNIMIPDLSWRKEFFYVSDAIEYAITFLIIAVLIWLYNREIEKSLKRAQESEKSLKKEKETLENTVLDRTIDFQRAQHEKVAQLYRFYEFGQLSAGIFHDIVNKMAAISLNIEQIVSRRGIPDTISKEMNAVLERSGSSLTGMEKYVEAARKQIQKGDFNEEFNVLQEIKDVLMVMSYKAKRKHVWINFLNNYNEKNKELKITGDKYKFNQLLANLVSNAIDSYEESKCKEKNCEIAVRLKVEKNNLLIIVEDSGQGISPERQEKIFKPFFSTKKTMGIGLDVTKKIVEKNFGGHISLDSQVGIGTKFFVKIPLKRSEEKQPYSDEVMENLSELTPIKESNLPTNYDNFFN